MSDTENNPTAGTPRDKIIQVINELRTYIQQDGGDLEFIDFTDEGIVKVRLHGACVGCPGAAMTLKNGVEARLKQIVPEVVAVEKVD